ncbi:MAG: HK97 family phage prohead protease [Candidatus Berkelbacteria bacterium]
MNIEELKRKKGMRSIYFKPHDMKSFDVDLNKREVTMAWNSFGFKDDDKDIILKGAFSKSISERGPKSSTYRKIAYLKYHNYNLPIGPPKEIREDDDYLIAVANIDPTPEGDTTLTQYQTGTLNQHSIGYRYIWDKMDYSETEDAFICKEIELWEGSAVVAGANENTPLLEVRGMNTADQMAQTMEEMEKLLRNVEIRNQYDLRKSISKLLALAEIKEPGKPPLPNPGEPQKVKEIDYEKLILAFGSQGRN